MRRVSQAVPRRRTGGPELKSQLEPVVESAERTPSPAGLTLLGAGACDVLPSLQFVRSAFQIETNGELLYRLCIALVERKLVDEELWLASGKIPIVFARNAIQKTIEQMCGAAFEDNLQYGLEICDDPDSAYGRDERVRPGGLVAMFELQTAGFVILGQAMKALDEQEQLLGAAFFQIVLLAPLLVTFSVDTQHRLPPERVATWPLTGRQRLLLSSVSFALNPLFIVLFFGYLFWMGLAAALSFVLLALIVHTTVYAVSRLPFKLRIHASLGISRAPFKVGGIAQEMWRGLQGTLDFWVALLIAVIGTLYRLFGRAPGPEAFPMLSLFVGIAMSTVAQRMLRLDEGRALLRYRLLPIAGWKLLVTQDMTFLIPLAVMVSLLSLRTGVAFGLVAIAVGRYPSLRQRANQRRWRFVGGDPRFGVAQLLLGGFAGVGAARTGLWVLAVAFAIYLVSIFWGEMLWKRSMAA